MYNIFSTFKKEIADGIYILGSLERIWSNSQLLTKVQLATLPKNREKVWLFKRCFIKGVVFHSEQYKRVVARNDYTVTFCDNNDQLCYGSIQTFVQVEYKCSKAVCSFGKCSCEVDTRYFVIVGVLDVCEAQLPTYRSHKLVNHIIKVYPSKR